MTVILSTENGPPTEIGSLSDIDLDEKITDRLRKINSALTDRDRAQETVESCEQSAVLSAWRLGKCLIEKKSRLAHGEWLPWLNQSGISQSSASDYMRLGKQITSAGSLKASIRATLMALPVPVHVVHEAGAAVTYRVNGVVEHVPVETINLNLVVEPGTAETQEMASAHIIDQLESELYETRERFAIVEESADPKSRKAIDKIGNQAELIKTLKPAFPK